MDLSIFNLLSLSLGFDEFKQTFLNSDKYKQMSGQQAPSKKAFGAKQEDGVPLMTSECPGWVCYAEKVVGDMAFPFMSKVKSAQ